MNIKVITVKAADKALRLTNFYSLLFKKSTNDYTKESVNQLNVFPEQVIRNADVFKGLEELNNYDMDNFDNVAQAEKPFWKVSWKDFDPKDFWEVARGWQWLRAFVHSKTEEERNEVIENIVKWLENNPYPNGLTWAVGLDVAIRAINLAIIYSVTEEKRFEKHLFEHYLYLKKMLWLSKNAIRNNHYLGELTAQTMLSQMFGKRQTEKLKEELKEEIENQFYKDGVNIEQSIRYHKFSLEFVILAKIFLGIETDKTRNAASFLLAVMKPDKTWPNIGDNDMGCVIRLHDDPLKKDYINLINLVAVLERDSELGVISGEISPESRLLIKKPEQKINSVKKEFPENTQIFPQGGFFVHRTGWTEKDSYLLIKFGPHKWHAHADLFHIELSINGNNIIIDSGTYRYNNVPEYRKYFRSTRAHNTLEFNNLDQTKQWTTFRWHKPAKVIDWGISNKDETIIIKAKHDGYKKQKVIHERILSCDKILQKVKVKDILKGKGNGPYKIYWHFDPSIEIRKVGETEFDFSENKKFLGKIKIISKKQIKTELLKTPFSRYYGHLSEQPTLCVSGEKEDKNTFIKSIFEFK